MVHCVYVNTYNKYTLIKYTYNAWNCSVSAVQVSSFIEHTDYKNGLN